MTKKKKYLTIGTVLRSKEGNDIYMKFEDGLDITVSMKATTIDRNVSLSK
jgi:hypothetical protein